MAEVEEKKTEERRGGENRPAGENRPSRENRGGGPRPNERNEGRPDRVASVVIGAGKAAAVPADVDPVTGAAKGRRRSISRN